MLINFRSQSESKGMSHQFSGNSRFVGGEVEYYNDLPGKSPPDLSSNAKLQQQPITKDSGTSQNRGPGFRHRPFRGIHTFKSTVFFSIRKYLSF